MQIEMDERKNVTVSAGTLGEIAAGFTVRHPGKYTGMQIVLLALMEGIEIGYKAGLEADRGMT